MKRSCQRMDGECDQLQARIRELEQERDEKHKGWVHAMGTISVLGQEKNHLQAQLQAVTRERDRAQELLRLQAHVRAVEFAQLQACNRELEQDLKETTLQREYAESKVQELEKAAMLAVEASESPADHPPFLFPTMEALRATLSHKERP
jgi:DNA repair exonuclease SbcCD ATPase subunit